MAWFVESCLGLGCRRGGSIGLEGRVSGASALIFTGSSVGCLPLEIFLFLEEISCSPRERGEQRFYLELEVLHV